MGQGRLDPSGSAWEIVSGLFLLKTLLRVVFLWKEAKIVDRWASIPPRLLNTHHILTLSQGSNYQVNGFFIWFWLGMEDGEKCLGVPS